LAIAARDGHDLFSTAEIDERDPDVAAVIDNVVEGFEIFFLAIELGRTWRSCERGTRT
jgi:hypothetical protein